MNIKILIIGPPQSGKSTLINKLIDNLSESKISVHGFLTPEVRSGNKRVGFDLVDIKTKQRVKLARKGKFNTKYRVGSYCVFLEDFDRFISKYDATLFQEADFFIIDEIGKMELYSKKFQDFINKIFGSNLSIIATIGSTVNHPIKDHLFTLPNIKIFNLERSNFEQAYQKIISIL